MVDTATLLLELGVEELPASSVAPLARHLSDGVAQALKEAGIAFENVSWRATPRRIAALLTNVEAKQADQQSQRRGPAVSAAFDEQGNPTKALAGFARSCGVEVEALGRLVTDKGEWLVFDHLQQGRSLDALLQESLPAIIRSMPMPRRMRWSDGDDEFLRPVQWLVTLHGADVLPVSVLGLHADRVTHGHRFLCDEPLVLSTADDYDAVLHDRGYVIADYKARRELIEKQVLDVARAAGGQSRIDAGLLDEVCALVEWPQALAGSFDDEFLELPTEALIQTMEENQRYFALFDEQGNLLPTFVTVANIASSHPATVREGNERVIRPRFADTLFFWRNDRRGTLLDFRDALEGVLFQEKLGSVLAKSQRVTDMAVWIAERIDADSEQCRLAGSLCKCDLMTDIVNELPKMQGIAGKYYAEMDGHPADVCAAMEEQYLPRQAGGSLPSTRVGTALALADRLDTLTGIFGIGLRPTGTKDPFALRRSSLAVLRLLIENSIDLDVAELVAEAAKNYGDILDAGFDQSELVTYIIERLRSLYQDKGIAQDVVDAVLATGVSRPQDIEQRVRAMAAFRQTDAADALGAANKRIRNILKKVEDPLAESVNAQLLAEPAEKNLAQCVTATSAEVVPLVTAGNYQAALNATARLREPVDAFFDDVMVMVDDAQLRANRLALLKQVGDLCSSTADLSLLQSPSTK